MSRAIAPANNLRLYLFITLLCGLSALCIELFDQGADRFRSYAETRLDNAVHQAVRAEVQQVADKTR